MDDPAIHKSIFLAAPRETVWSFLTDKDKLGEWFFKAEADLADGTDYALIETAADGTITKKCWGTVLEMNAPTHLKYTFTIEPLGGALTTVAWTLEEAHGGTRLTLFHEGISAAAGEAAMGLLLALDGGWDKHLAGLRKVI